MKNSERIKIDPNLGKDNFGGMKNPDTEWAQNLTRPPSKSEKAEGAEWDKQIKKAKQQIAEAGIPLVEDEATLQGLGLRELKPGEQADGDWDAATAFEARRTKREQGGLFSRLKKRLTGENPPSNP